MARPMKQGLDYFPLDCQLDVKFQLIEAEFGLQGFAIVVKLLQKIYGGFGYYCEWNTEVALLFSRDSGVGGGVVSEIIESAVKRGIFSKEMYDKFHILTSAGIQQRYVEACKRRSKILIEEQYLLLKSPKNQVNVTEIADNVTKTGINVYDNTQSKLKESKKKYIKKQNSFNNFEQRNCDGDALEEFLLKTNGV